MTSIDPVTLAPGYLAQLLQERVAGYHPDDATLALLRHGCGGVWLRRRDFLTACVDVTADGWATTGSANTTPLNRPARSAGRRTSAHRRDLHPRSWRRPEMTAPNRPGQRPPAALSTGLRAAALRTGGAGWWVFPVRPGGKTPAAPAAHPAGSPEGSTCRGGCGRWGHGLHDATTDSGVVEAMWRRWPAANLGISCGPSGLVVIDLDTTAGPRPARVLRDQDDDEPTPDDVRDGASGLAWLCERRDGRREDLDTLTVATPSGGWHLYFRAPDPDTGLRVTSGAGMASGLGWGIDIRAWGGYVVAPPSVRPEGHYTSLGGVLRPLPGWLLAALTSAGRVDGRAAANTATHQELRRPRLRLIRGQGEGTESAEQRRHRYLTAAVRGELQRVWDAPAGALNDTVTRAAFALGQLVTGAGLDRHAVADALLDAARHAGAVHAAAGGKAFDEAKTVATITRALTAGAAHPRTAGR